MSTSGWSHSAAGPSPPGAGGEPRRRPRRRLQAAALFLVYAALAVAATWPLAWRARDHLFGEGTPLLNVWAMGFVLHQLPRAPLRLFDGNAFYPYGETLAFSEHLLVPALLAAPVAALTGNLVLAHNAVALATLALAGLGMFLLARELTGDAPAAFAAGLLYAFHTWNVNELARLQILSSQWFPLLLLALVRYFARPGRGRAAAAGLAYLLHSLSCMYWALYAPFVAAPAIAALAWRRRLSWRELVPLGAALGLALLVALPFALPYVRTARELGFARGLPDALALDRYLDVLPGNRLYAGWLGTARVNQDAAHFLGFGALALGLFGAWRGRFAAAVPLGRGLFLGFALAGLLLSLGPELGAGAHTLGPGPYALLYRFVPGFRNVRYPERFCILLVLGLAPLVAAGLARLRPRLTGAGVAAAGLLFFAEHFSAPLPLVHVPAGQAIPPVYRWLARQEDARVVADVPATRHLLERFDALPMYFSTVHWKRTPQGLAGYFPPAYNFTRWRLFHWPEEDTLAFLERFGVDSLVLAPGAAPPAADGARFRLDGPFHGGQRVLRLLRAGGQGYAPPEDDPVSDGFVLVEVPRAGWDVQASHPGAERAIDGDPSTAWATDGPQGRGDFYRVRWARPLRLARVSLVVTDPYCFPMHVKLLADVAGAEPVELPFDERAAYDGLFARLLHRPREARLDLDVAPDALRDVRGVRVRVTQTDPFLMPWSLAEVRLFEARGGAPAGGARSDVAVSPE